MKILLVRHARTAGNLQRRYVGRTDEPLCAAGRDSVRQTAEWIHSLLHAESIPVPRIWVTSPMRRCTETAELLAQMLNISNPHYITEESLREMDFGDFEYKNYAELAGNRDYQRYLDSGGTAAFPGGESLDEFQERCVQGFAGQIGSLPDDCTVGCVVHGGTIMAVLDRFAHPHRGYFSWQCGNGCGYLAEAEGSGLRLRVTAAIPGGLLDRND